MPLKISRNIPLLLAFGVLLPLLGLAWLRPDLTDRFERITYDFRVRAGLHFSARAATNLAFAYIDENTIRAVRSGRLGYTFGLYWPRQVYGRLVDELTEQGATAVAFDVMFGERRPDHPPIRFADGALMESDDYFAHTLARASNVILAASHDLAPPPVFLTNAWAVGDIATDKDSDGILRRVRVFRSFPQWHWVFQQLEAQADYGVDLRRAQIEPRRIVLPREGEDPIEIPLDAEGRFDLADFGGEDLPAGVPRWDRPFREERRWHMGVLLAGRALGVDFSRAVIDLRRGRVTLPLASGADLTLPVDAQGFLYIDWSLPPNHPTLYQVPVHELLDQNRRRWEGQGPLTDSLHGKLVVIGSSALANDLTDRGATPLSKDKDTLLVSKHWNVANSLLTGRFVRRTSPPLDLMFVAVLGMFSAGCAWRARPAVAVSGILLLLTAYAAAAFLTYGLFRLWIPMVLPMATALTAALAVLSYRVVFAEAERRRVRAVFAKMVSPRIVAELLKAPRLALGGTRREITVFFADVRGFTEYTDSSQEQVLEFIRKKGLSGPAAEACFEDHARETLATVNLYLGAVANVVIGNHGTLDKFIGDCVMAFWGAPTDNPRHALDGVRAAVAAQRAVHDLNRQRLAENERRRIENQQRAARGLEPSPLLPTLTLGSGINSGIAVAGLMGSAESDSMSYTVFGREVNLASRLEGASGSGRIFISEGTWNHLRRDDPALAATCIAHEPIKVKGFRAPVKVYEVPWLLPEPGQSPPPPLPASPAT